MSIFSTFQEEFKKSEKEIFTLEEYLQICKKDPLAFSSAAERMIKAIGEPKLVETSTDERLSRIFLNRTIKVYPTFSMFHGMEETIERIVAYFKHAAQGLEERKQILYLLGPVGGGKSSIAERLKELMEVYPIYSLAINDGNEVSPVFESALGLFHGGKYDELLEGEYGINRRYLKTILSPWAVKRLKDFKGDIAKFCVVKLYPSKLEQIALFKTEPGDDNNQDISCLVGKTNIRMLEKYSQNDPDSYSFSGALNRSNQGMLEFCEMFKAPIKVLHPLLTATQEGNYVGTETIGGIPFNGIIMAHSNMSEWISFKNNKNNEAFLDRICVIKVPYCLRKTEESLIYKKMLESSDLHDAPIAPKTLEILAKFSVLTRLTPPENSSVWTKMLVYDGENTKEKDPKSKPLQEYKQAAGLDEGMDGMSTRFAFKVLSQAFNHDPVEIAADPINLMLVLQNSIEREQLPKDVQDSYITFLNKEIREEYLNYIENEIQTCYLGAYDSFGQNMFDRYIDYADHWLQELEFKDPDTGEMYDRSILNAELEKIEKAAGIANPKDFRQEVVSYAMRRKAKDQGVLNWKAYEKLKKVIEKKMFSSLDDLLPVISYSVKQTEEDEKKHESFIARMGEKGYTRKQTRRVTEWFVRVKKS